MTRCLALACWLLLLAPAVSAGTQDDPEILDDSGDVRWSPLPVSPELVPFPTAHDETFDILATWFHDETPTSISITMQVVDLAAVEDFGPPGVGFARWGTRFEMSNYEPDTRDNWWNYTWIAQVNLNNGPAGWRGGIEAPDAGGERGEVVSCDFEVDRDAGTLKVVVPRVALGSPAAGDRMFDTLSLHDGRIGEVDFHDQSPDGTYPSRDYVFTMDTGVVEDGGNETAGPGIVPQETTSASPTGENGGSSEGGSDARRAPASLTVWVLLAVAWAGLRSRR